MEAATQTKEIERLLAESEWITGLAVSLLGDPHRAEDLAQETRLAALRAPRKRGEGSMRPWLATVARNAARKLYRSDSARRARETERARDQAGALGSSPEELLGQLETQELVSRLVRELPEELSDVIVLSFFEGLSAEQISKLRKIPAGTVRWRKKKGLDGLRERLDTHFEGDRSAWMSALVPLASPSWRAGAKGAASGGGIFAGLFAPWIAMTLTWKLVSIALLASLLAIPFALGGDDGLVETEEHASLPEEAVVVLPTAPIQDTSMRPDEPVVAQAMRTGIAAQTPASPDHVTTRVRLRVVNEQGAPIENATVRIVPSNEVQVSHAQLLEELNPLEIARLLAQMERLTDSEGIARWESDLLRVDGMIDFEVVGPHFESGSITALLEVGGELDLGDVVLKAAGSVAGRVYGPAGLAPQSIRITLLGVERDELGTEIEADIPKGLMSGVASTRTEANGSFQFDGVPAGEYRAHLQVLPDWTSYRSLPFEVQTGTRAVNVEIHCAVPLRKSEKKNIQILGADGEPLATAYVSLRGGSYSSAGVVDESGGWGNLGDTLHHFRGGELRVVDRSLRHQPKTVSPLPQQIAGLVVQLELAQTVERGLILRATDGSEVRGGRLQLTLDGFTTGVELSTHGESLLLPAAQGERFHARFEAKGFLPVEFVDLDATALPDPWEVELAPQVGIRGVVKANGKPLEKAEVLLHRHVQEGRVSTRGNDVNLATFAELDKVVTGEDGVFRLHQDEEGSFVVAVSARGYGDHYALIADFEPVLGVTDLEIDLLEPGTVEGVVRDHLGNPVPRAYVVLDHPYFKAKRKRASRDGSFRFRKVPPGDWILRSVEKFEDGFFNQTSQVIAGWDFPENCKVQAGMDTQQDVVLPDPGSTSITAKWSGSPQDADSSPRPLTLRIETLNGIFLGRDPFLADWKLKQELSMGEPLSIPLQAGRGYQARVETPGLSGRLYRDFPSDELPAEIDIALDFATLTLDAKELKASGATMEQVVIRWQQGPWKYSSTLWPDAEMRFEPTLIPAGEVVLTYQLAGEKDIRRLNRIAAANETLSVSLE